MICSPWLNVAWSCIQFAPPGLRASAQRHDRAERLTWLKFAAGKVRAPRGACRFERAQDSVAWEFALRCRADPSSGSLHGSDLRTTHRCCSFELGRWRGEDGSLAESGAVLADVHEDCSIGGSSGTRGEGCPGVELEGARGLRDSGSWLFGSSGCPSQEPICDSLAASDISLLWDRNYWREQVFCRLNRE